MKKSFIYALLSAIALTGTVNLTSCTSSDDVAEVSPYYDPDKNEVVTDFVFNVANSAKASSRQSSAATQAVNTEQFRGIDNAKLFTFVNGDANDGKHVATSTDFGKTIDLANVVVAGGVTSTKSNRILEIALPIKTNALVFYGKAPNGTVSTAESDAGYNASDVFGSILTGQNGNATKLSDLTFTLNNRLGDNSTKYHQAEQLLAGILTCLINTNLSQMSSAIDKNDTPTDQVTTKYGYDIPASDAIKAIKWEDYANADKKSPVNDSHTLYALEEKLADVYSQMTKIKTGEGELRAASGDAIIRMVQDMWTIASEVRYATPLCYEEAVAKYFAQVLFSNINSFFNATTLPVNGTAVSGTGFKTLDNLISALETNKYWPASAGTKPSVFTALSEGGSEEKKMQSFPVSFNIPRGASHILFDNTKKAFAYPAVFDTSGMGTSGNFGVEDYYYCPEILYFGNSPVRTSAIDHKNNYPDGVANWNDATNWDTVNDWTGQHVASSTRSVAMKNNINYGTSLLRTTVKLPAGVTHWKDNNHAIQISINPDLGNTDEPDNEIEVGNGKFLLTGVIVGGQSKNVGWDMTPRTVKTGTDVETGEDVYGYQFGFVYDKAIPDEVSSVPTAADKANYTMLFDNYDSSKGVSAQPPVNVALEFTNNTGKDFYGNHNLIRNGGTFYLIGQLDPNKAGLTTPDWPTDHPLPPYNADGTSIQAKRVFMQDYVTSANFVIGEESLKSAYLTVPDLRATSLTLGLSVDIEWRTGIDFGDVTLGE